MANPSTGIVAEITHLVGEAAALKIVSRWGGRDVCFTRERRELAMLIGADAAHALEFHFKRVTVYVPMLKAQATRARHAAMQARFCDLTSRMSARRAVVLLAEEFRTTERNVWRVMKKPINTPPCNE
jgi:hypothetical protein